MGDYLEFTWQLLLSGRDDKLSLYLLSNKNFNHWERHVLSEIRVQRVFLRREVCHFIELKKFFVQAIDNLPSDHSLSLTIWKIDFFIDFSMFRCRTVSTTDHFSLADFPHYCFEEFISSRPLLSREVQGVLY